MFADHQRQWSPALGRARGPARARRAATAATPAPGPVLTPLAARTDDPTPTVPCPRAAATRVTG